MNNAELKLIKSVKQYPCLYNKSDFGFRNRQKREEAWSKVAQECGLPISQSQCRWKTLRDRFVREYHKAGEDRKWNHFKDMSFLQEHIKIRDFGQQDLVVTDTELACENDESNHSWKTEFGSRKDYDRSYDNEEDVTFSEADFGMQQAQEEFIKVMGLLENALEERCTKKSTDEMDSDASLSDPFYKYLESILSRVDEATRADIQLELLNFANKLVKSANPTS